jgi:hypothetical protein
MNKDVIKTVDIIIYTLLFGENPPNRKFLFYLITFLALFTHLSQYIQEKICFELIYFFIISKNLSNFDFHLWETNIFRCLMILLHV